MELDVNNASAIAARCLGCGEIVAVASFVEDPPNRELEWNDHDGNELFDTGRWQIVDTGDLDAYASPCRCTELIRELRERVESLDAERELVRAAVSHEDAIEFDLAGISVARRSDAWGPFYVLTRPDEQAKWERVKDSPEFKTLYDALPLVGKMKKDQES